MGSVGALILVVPGSPFSYHRFVAEAAARAGSVFGAGKLQVEIRRHCDDGVDSDGDGMVDFDAGVPAGRMDRQAKPDQAGVSFGPPGYPSRPAQKGRAARA